MSPTEHLLGEETLARIRKVKVLLVGAGGIGCELLKDLVLAGFGDIHVVDMDVIDLSNLNRQFLFRPKHIKKSKAIVAAETASKFNHDINIVPYQSNIMAPEFGPKWFFSFDLVFNALDNAEARHYVNKMCVAGRVPLIDAGSAGFEGQTRVVIPGVSECYDCIAHPSQKRYAVCTIRSTPTQPVHCIEWAKSYLFTMLFGVCDEGDELDLEEDPGEAKENAEELQKLRQESLELSKMKGSSHQPEFVDKVVQRMYVSDIARLAANETVWAERQPPVPLQKPLKWDPLDTDVGASICDQDQQVWTVRECLQVLSHIIPILVKRASTQGALEFDKDDDDSLNFVAAASTLRCHVFGLEEKSKFDIKQIAGNIIPSVATTNAVLSGLAVVEAIKIMREDTSKLRSVNIWRSDKKLLNFSHLTPPNKSCAVCSVARATILVPTNQVTLEELVNKYLKADLGYRDVSIIADGLIYDPDFEDNLLRTLASLELSDKFVTVLDEDDKLVNLEILISNSEQEPYWECISVPERQQSGKRPLSPEFSEVPVKKQRTTREGSFSVNGEGLIVDLTNADDKEILIE